MSDIAFLISAGRGTEALLAEELRELGARETREVPGGVEVREPYAFGMRVCLWSRIAMGVLMRIGEDERVRTDRQLYSAVRNLPLARWFDAERTIAVFAKVRDNDNIRHGRFASLRVKDAIVDDVRDRLGERPNVSPKDPDVPMVMHLHGTHARFYLSLEGGALNRRGYRVRDVKAPLKETLAAALLRFSGWNGKRPLVDPTCGSGTIPIEAAWIATDRAPGLERTFAFERFAGFDDVAEAWEMMKVEALDRIKPLRASIVGSDRNEEAILACRANALAAGLGDSVVFREMDARDIEPIPGGGAIVFNPPYGERIGGGNEGLLRFYDHIGTHFGQFADHRIAWITLESLIEEQFGGPPDRVQRVLNGKLRCAMAVWDT